MAPSQEYDAAMDRALKYLGPRGRSRREVADLLRRSRYGEPAVRQVVSRLEELSILDDAAYAAEAARQGRAKGKGARALRRDLALQGVCPDAIEDAISESFPPETEQALVFEAASKKAAGLQGLPPRAQYRRLAGYLARRGHDPEVVGAVCRQILGDFAGSD